MAATDARPIPKKNTAYRLYFVLTDTVGNLVTGATGLDSERSLDGAAFSDCTNEATEVGSGWYYLELTAAEMNTDATLLRINSSDSIELPLVIYPEEDGDIRTQPSSLASSVITATSIATDAITAAKIATDAITATKVADNTITAAKIASGAISSGKIASNAIGAGKIAADAITATKIASGAITAAKIATDAITADKIAADAITAAKIAADAIGASEIAADAIGASELATGAVNEIRDAILSDSTPFAGANIDAAISAAGTLTSGERDSIADALLDRTNGIETSLTPREAIRLMSAVLFGELSGGGTGTVTIEAANNPGTNRIVATVSASSGDRISLTLTP